MGFTQARMHVAQDDERAAGSVLHALPELKQTDVVSLIDPEVERSAELLVGKVVLRPGGGIPLHSHTHSETVFVLQGTVNAQLGKGMAEIVALGAAYFPAGAMHGIRSVDGEDATFLICYPRGTVSRPLETTLADPDADSTNWPNPNIISAANVAYRWALVEQFEPSMPVEPTKGWNLTLRYLFDPKRGAPDLVAGTGGQEPHVHYTIHRHEPPEVFYVLEGEGTIYVGNESYEVQKGSTVYVPSRETHGIDTGDSAIRVYWVYGLDRCGPDWTWEAVEPIYNHPRR